MGHAWLTNSCALDIKHKNRLSTLALNSSRARLSCSIWSIRCCSAAAWWRLWSSAFLRISLNQKQFVLGAGSCHMVMSSRACNATIDTNKQTTAFASLGRSSIRSSDHVAACGVGTKIHAKSARLCLDFFSNSLIAKHRVLISLRVLEAYITVKLQKNLDKRIKSSQIFQS